MRPRVAGAQAVVSTVNRPCAARRSSQGTQSCSPRWADASWRSPAWSPEWTCWTWPAAPATPPSPRRRPGRVSPGSTSTPTCSRWHASGRRTTWWSWSGSRRTLNTFRSQTRASTASCRPARPTTSWSFGRCGASAAPVVRSPSPPGGGTAQRWTSQSCLDSGALEHLDLFDGAPGAQHDAGERVVREAHRHAGLVLEPLAEATQQRAAAREQDAVAREVGRQLGRRVLERVLDRVEDLHRERLERLTELPARDCRLARQAAHRVAAAHLGERLGLVGSHPAHLALHGLRRGLADGEPVVAADPAGHGVVEVVATHS